MEPVRVRPRQRARTLAWLAMVVAPQSTVRPAQHLLVLDLSARGWVKRARYLLRVIDDIELRLGCSDVAEHTDAEHAREELQQLRIARDLYKPLRGRIVCAQLAAEQHLDCRS